MVRELVAEDRGLAQTDGQAPRLGKGQPESMHVLRVLTEARSLSCHIGGMNTMLWPIATLRLREKARRPAASELSSLRSI